MINPDEVIFWGMEILTIIVKPGKEPDELCIAEIITVEEEPITLHDIENIVKKKFNSCSLITVLAEEPLGGVIYKYGNHGDFWEEAGTLAGFA